MAKINLIQLLCPQRHCIAAVAFDEATTTPKEAQATLETGLERINVNRWCGICGSKDLNYEIGQTRFDSLEEATPHLIEEQEKNLEARAYFENLRRTAKNN